MDETLRDKSLNFLTELFGGTHAQELCSRLERIIEKHLNQPQIISQKSGPLTERDAVLITYGNQLQQEGKPPLETLDDFLRRRLRGLLSSIHILPFFPYSSDDGFSIIDYRQVNPEWGDWEDINRISLEFRFMVDAVINHVSAESPWFKAYIASDPRYENYFIEVDPEADLSQVVRPRDLPLLTEAETRRGSKHLWTTFSTDQIDLNFANPAVLFEIIDLLLFYIRNGAQLIRLDAIAFLWKELGTPCIHLPQTHQIIKLFRAIFETIAPWVIIITETNVPHEENLSYFGNGRDEAHMVYQFALPPLVLHTLLEGNSSKLTHWADSLRTPSKQATFFNFLASHDGIGLRPVDGILSAKEINNLVETTLARGGGVSYRQINDGSKLPYELNITYLDALTPPAEYEQDPQKSVARFLVSQGIMLAMAGLPGIYFHSLFGSRNYLNGVEEFGHLRSINRETLDQLELERELADPNSLRSMIFTGYSNLLSVRGSHPAFSPLESQQIFDIDPVVFCLIRGSKDSNNRVLCLFEIAGMGAQLSLTQLGPRSKPIDLLSRRGIQLDRLRIYPYQVRWISLDR